jgi:opacity protein-like surface antigen
MNNILKLSFLFVFVLISGSSLAQSFAKNDKIIEAGFGLGIYDTHIYNKTTKINENSRAAAWVFPVSFEYAFRKRLAIGVAYKYSNFITSNDSVQSNAQMSGNDIALKPTFHIIKSKRLNVYIGALAGLAWVNYQLNDSEKAYVKGNGTILAYVFGTRFYITKNVGLGLNYLFNNYNFVDLTLANNQAFTDKLNLTLKRGNVNLGLVVKIN